MIFLLPVLATKNKIQPKDKLTLKISAQGGVGTSEEHEFLLDHYEVDSVGWGTPFLLVPEATTVDKDTIEKMTQAKEKDLYLSNISPLGIPFHSLRGNTKDEEKAKHITNGRPGSACPKKFVALNKEFTEKGICTASRQYQHLKIKELKEKDLEVDEYNYKYNQIIEKSCTCVGLGTSALLAYDLDIKVEGPGVSVCPGPNMAYFSKTMKLNEIIDHIYGRKNDIVRADRPHMFAKELTIYMDYLKGKIKEAGFAMNKKQEKYLVTFTTNLEEGIHYYKGLFEEMKDKFQSSKEAMMHDFDENLVILSKLNLQIAKISNKTL